MILHTACLATILFSTTFAQNIHTLKGMIVNASSREPLSAANIRVFGTTRGTITNKDGVFQISLPAGTHTIVVSYVGYQSDSSVIALPQTLQHKVALIPIAVPLPEIIVSDEDPAYQIMRNVIAEKRKWLESLVSFEAKAYTRTSVRHDTAIMMIAESYSTVDWSKGDSLREVITQKRQSENVPSSLPLAYVGEIVNFYEDRISDGGFTFVGPTAHDAFSYYSYRLKNALNLDDVSIYEIEVIAKSRLTPLYQGTILIAGETYAMIETNLQPNEAFILPFMKTSAIRFRQQFRHYENKFWLPADYRLDARMDVSLLVTSVKVAVERSVVFYDYLINANIPDSLKAMPKLAINPQASIFDSTFWAETNVLPLTSEEQIAYVRIDSLATIAKERQTRSSVGRIISSFIPVVQHIDMRFNRVEGLFLGGKVSIDTVLNLMKLHGRIGYGISDDQWKYKMGSTFYPFRTREVGVGLELYRTLAHIPDANLYGTFEISLAALLRKEDYRDYYSTSGSRWFVELRPQGLKRFYTFDIGIGYSHEKHKSVTTNTNFALGGKDRSYRQNPHVADGLFRSVSMHLEIGNLLQSYLRDTQWYISSSIEHSSRDMLKSSFDFTQIRTVMHAKVPTMYRSHLLKPFLAILISGGISFHETPPQRLFTLESRLSDYAPFGVMHGAAVKEFSGDRFISMHLEHNFRSIPFQAVGISSRYEIILYASASRTWLVNRHTLSFLLANPTLNWYYEAGFGISRLLEVLRLDFTWRGTSPQACVVTLGTADLF